MGKFGCEYCPDCFGAIPEIEYVLKKKNPWIRDKALTSELGGIPDKTLYMPGSQDELEYIARFRIARNIRRSFFLNNRTDISEVRDFLKSYFPRVKRVPEKDRDAGEYWTAWKDFGENVDESSSLPSEPVGSKNPKKKSNSILEIGFILGDEDQIRWEIFWKGRIQIEESVQMPNFPRKKELFSFLGHRELFSFHKNWGFLNACPTNCGRGDRFSILIQRGGSPKIGETREDDWFFEKNGIRLSILNQGKNSEKRYISVKNFNKRRKIYFLQYLVPLIFKDSGFVEIPLSSSNK